MSTVPFRRNAAALDMLRVTHRNNIETTTLHTYNRERALEFGAALCFIVILCLYISFLRTVRIVCFVCYYFFFLLSNMTDSAKIRVP